MLAAVFLGKTGDDSVLSSHTLGGEICKVPRGGSQLRMELPHTNPPWPHLWRCVWSLRDLVAVWPLGQPLQLRAVAGELPEEQGGAQPRRIAEHITQCNVKIVFPLKFGGKRDCAPTGKIVLLVDMVVLELWLNLQNLTVIKVQPPGYSSVQLHLGTLRGLY